ncbi:MAG: glycine cleavage system regulatory protein [Candidatus Pelagisphaera sp.]
MRPRAIFTDLRNMNIPLVMTVIGPDRPGLVDSVASLVAEHGGNWLESRMCHLGGQFAGLLRVEIDESAGEKLRAALSELSGQQLEIIVHRSSSDESNCSEVAMVEIIGQDRPGIVKEIANAFASEGVNVEELSSHCSSAPMSGERLFEAKAKVCIPESCDTDKLRERLESIAEDLQVDVSFESIDL